jgi:hypothetical protein
MSPMPVLNQRYLVRRFVAPSNVPFFPVAKIHVPDLYQGPFKWHNPHPPGANS